MPHEFAVGKTFEKEKCFRGGGKGEGILAPHLLSGKACKAQRSGEF
jgi:hypothetical protein